MPCVWCRARLQGPPPLDWRHVVTPAPAGATVGAQAAEAAEAAEAARAVTSRGGPERAEGDGVRPPRRADPVRRSAHRAGCQPACGLAATTHYMFRPDPHGHGRAGTHSSASCIRLLSYPSLLAILRLCCCCFHGCSESTNERLLIAPWLGLGLV